MIIFVLRKKEKETREELRKQAWAQELERRKEKKRIKEEEKQKVGICKVKLI